MARDPLYYDIPDDARFRPCRHCRRAITFVETETGRQMPVDPPDVGTKQGQSHFQTCTHPNEFSRRGAPR